MRRMSRTIYLDLDGNITPLCIIADALIFNEDVCKDCQYKTDNCIDKASQKPKIKKILSGGGSFTKCSCGVIYKTMECYDERDVNDIHTVLSRHSEDKKYCPNCGINLK